MNALPRPSILSVEPYQGGESRLPGANRAIKLSSNEGALGPPPGAVEAVAAAAREAHRYPDGGGAALREALGRRFGLDPARIVLGNGSDELLTLLVLAYGGEGTELVMSAHGFLMYDLAGRWAGCRVLKVPERDLAADVDAMIAACGPRTRLVMLANPNNPTGALLPRAEVERLRAGMPAEALLVLDAAYAEYVEEPGYDPGQGLVDASGGAVMTRTFSKVWGLGGLRLGWAYAPPRVVDVLNRVRGPFNVSSAAMAAGIAALAEPGWLERSLSHNRLWRGRLAEGLSALGLAVRPSAGNFLLVGFGTAEAARAADARLRQRGILVRAMDAYGLPDHLRVTVGAAEECAALLDALADGPPARG